VLKPPLTPSLEITQVGIEPARAVRAVKKYEQSGPR